MKQTMTTNPAPWLVFSDLDGTLGIEGQQIPLRNRQAIRRFVENGGRFGICTGRSPESARDFLQDIPVNAPSVVNGGCALYDFAPVRSARSSFCRRPVPLPLNPWPGNFPIVPW